MRFSSFVIFRIVPSGSTSHLYSLDKLKNGIDVRIYCLSNVEISNVPLLLRTLPLRKYPWSTSIESEEVVLFKVIASGSSI